MDIKKSVNRLARQEMNRREFLRNVGVAALTLAGVTAVVKSLGGQHDQGNSSTYGTSTYGGRGADKA